MQSQLASNSQLKELGSACKYLCCGNCFIAVSDSRWLACIFCFTQQGLFYLTALVFCSSILQPLGIAQVWGTPIKLGCAVGLHNLSVLFWERFTSTQLLVICTAPLLCSSLEVFCERCEHETKRWGNLCHHSQPGIDRALGALGLLFQFEMQLVIASAGGGAGPANCWPIRGSLGSPLGVRSLTRGHVLGEAVSVRIQLMLQKVTVLPQSLFAFILSVTKCHLIYISLVFWNTPLVAWAS